MSSHRKEDFLIVALDFDNLRSVEEMVSKLPSVGFYKVGMELFYSEGRAIIDQLKDRGKKIFLDLKINDIPKTIEKTVRKLATYDVDYLTVFCDDVGVRAAREGAGDTRTRILNVTVLTSQKAASDEVLKRAKMSFHGGAHGVICSGLETLDLRVEIPDNEFIIVNPGIRLVAGEDDQVRTVTPAQAHAAGATNIVVGRPITTAEHPEAVVRQIFESCQLI